VCVVRQFALNTSLIVSHVGAPFKVVRYFNTMLTDIHRDENMNSYLMASKLNFVLFLMFGYIFMWKKIPCARGKLIIYQ